MATLPLAVSCGEGRGRMLIIALKRVSAVSSEGLTFSERVSLRWTHQSVAGYSGSSEIMLGRAGRPPRSCEREVSK
jgi:hypothetical protein